MRGDLKKIEGISEIKTDIKTTTASFKLDNPELDDEALKAKLDEFAETNEHMKDWSFIEEEKEEGKEGQSDKESSKDAPKKSDKGKKA